MVTILTKNECYMFNLSSYANEIELCNRLSAAKRGDSSYCDKKFKINCMDTFAGIISLKDKTFFIRPRSIEHLRFEQRAYSPVIGEAINKLIKEVSDDKKD